MTAHVTGAHEDAGNVPVGRADTANASARPGGPRVCGDGGSGVDPSNTRACPVSAADAQGGLARGGEASPAAHAPEEMLTPSVSRRAARDLLPGDLATVTLDELNARAAMLTRVDRKYVLRREDVPEVLSDLDAETRVLEIAGERTQRYASTYFDTPDLLAYRLTAHPRRRRFKVRTRSYVDSGLAFLEVKTRGPRGRTVKQRIPHPCGIDEAHRLDGAGREWVRGLLVAGLVVDERSAGAIVPRLEAVLHGAYHRSTFLLPGDGGRATVDQGLVWRSREGREVDCSDMVIVETKSGSTPSDLDRLLWRAGHRPARISKYATALAALDPTLPANRWRRTLGTHFAA